MFLNCKKKHFEHFIFYDAHYLKALFLDAIFKYLISFHLFKNFQHLELALIGT